MGERIQYNKYIVADPDICHGKPTFAGTRIMVWQVLELLEAGVPVEDIVGDDYYPQLTKQHVEAALNYAGTRAKEPAVDETYVT